MHVYDHHPASAEDIRGAVEVIEEVGANTTLMVELLRRRGLTLSPEEATLLALGIYEDTGSLTFASTTPRDLQAAAWLLEQGANLNIVADHIARDLTPEQVLLLNDLLRSLRRHAIRGVEVAVATASRPGYIGDLAVLTGKLRDMENLGAVFVAVRMGAAGLRRRPQPRRVGGRRGGRRAARRRRAPHGGLGRGARAAPGAGEGAAAARRCARRSCPPRLAREIMTHPVTSIERGAPAREGARGAPAHRAARAPRASTAAASSASSGARPPTRRCGTASASTRSRTT